MAGLLFRGHVGLAGAIVTHDDRCKMWSSNAMVDHISDFRRYLFLYLFRDDFTINNLIHNYKF